MSEIIMTYVFPAMTDGLLVGGSRHYPWIHSTVKNIIPQHETKSLSQKKKEIIGSTTNYYNRCSMHMMSVSPT